MLLQQEVSNVRAHHSLKKVYDIESMTVRKMFQANIQDHVPAFNSIAPFTQSDQGVLYESYKGRMGSEPARRLDRTGV